MQTMKKSKLREEAGDIVEQFEEHLDIDEDDVVERLNDLVNEYQVPLTEAKQSLQNNYRDEAGIEQDDMSGTGAEEALINEVREDDKWVNVEVQVIELWDPPHESISQTGLIGDASGESRFTVFEDANQPTLEEGESYRIETAVIDEYEGDYSVKLVSTSEVTELDEEVSVGGLSIEGAIVDFQAGSGLIKRCPHDGCTRVIDEGRCAEHGSVDGEFDMRIKAVLDTGEELHTAIFSKDETVELTGMSVSEAKQKAQDAMDTKVVANEMKKDVVGRYYTVTGQPYRDMLLVDDYEKGTSIDPESVLTQARSI
jgi:replication factor A1